jgi:hypothetical protein
VTGTSCDRCKAEFDQHEEIVALRDTGREIVAGYTIAGEDGAIRETFEPVGKYHVDCYRQLREQQPDEFPELP